MSEITTEGDGLTAINSGCTFFSPEWHELGRHQINLGVNMWGGLGGCARMSAETKRIAESWYTSKGSESVLNESLEVARCKHGGRS